MGRFAVCLSDPPSRAQEPARQALDPARQASEPVRQASEPTKQTSEPAGQASEPASQASEPATQVSEALEGGNGRMDGRMDERRTENLPILQDFVPYRGRCPATVQLQPKNYIKRGKGTADHMMPLGDWFLY